MIEELSIKNFALIDNARIELEGGLNVFTGETGAGKSIIIDALGLLLGFRASAGNIRAGEKNCEVTGVFNISSKKMSALRLKLDEMGISLEPDEPLIIKRVVDVEGRSRQFVNSQAVNVSALWAMGEYLVDIHGQNEHQSLFNISNQRQILDEYALNSSIMLDYAKSRAALLEINKKIEELNISEQEKNQKIDLYKFQLEEITASKLKPGEDEEISAILPQIKNKDRLNELYEKAYGVLYENEPSASGQIAAASKLAQQITAAGVDASALEENLTKAQYLVEETITALRAHKENLGAGGMNIDELIARQELISKLKKKYGPDISKIIDHARKLKEELFGLQQRDELLAGLQAQQKAALKNLQLVTKKLSVSRESAGEVLSKSMVKELKELGMSKAKFCVSVETLTDESGSQKFTEHGSDKVEFLISPNPGEGLKPLKNIASGGEISRIMLCLKKIISEADNTPSLVYDEIDAGIGGGMGHIVGNKLKMLAEKHQVICISHLPQIASKAAAHYFIGKEVSGGRTSAAVKKLSLAERQREIARMLDGDSLTATSLAHAREMLSNIAK